MRPLARLAAAIGAGLAAAQLVGCGHDPGDVLADDVAFEVTIEGTSSRLVIDYTLTNTGDRTLVAYDRVEKSRSPHEFGSDADRVYVSRADGQVEIAKKIDHPCHEDPDRDDCAAEAPVTWRIGGTLVEPGEELGDRIELPARGEPGFVETRGQSVTFCLGVAAIDEDNPAAPDGRYPPTSPQTVLCSDPVPIPADQGLVFTS